ncbi:thioredoxin-like domain-containing protein [Ascidiimonas aurantiaca]|uniref:thioredoxin-like domain-containing protein n=1 Tax=Ascidiimonas aurantiaca TaxID=1685432 RepID=UPI0030EE57E0
MFKKHFFSLLAVLLLLGCNKKVTNDFTLTVNLTKPSKNMEYLILSYLGEQGYEIEDTVSLKNQKAVFKGKINGGTFAFLRSNTSTTFTDDPNHTHFYLHPSKMNITLKENAFKEGILKGSVSQNDHTQLKTQLKDLENRQRDLVMERNRLFKEMQTGKNPKEAQKGFNKILEDIKVVRAQMQQEELRFIKDNPDSYVSVYELLGLANSNTISMDVIEELYESLSDKVKKSTYSQRILQNIENYKQSRIGSQATNFTAQDPSGKSISLADFKGKYVLLDFWADWCKPCKEDQPLIKKMYSEYHKEGLEIIGISYDRSREAWLQAIKKEELGSWHHVLDEFKNVNVNTIGETFKVKPIPAYILIDPRGVIAGRYAAADGNRQNTLEDLEQDLKDIFE